jgi:hypothetical protein
MKFQIFFNYLILWSLTLFLALLIVIGSKSVRTLLWVNILAASYVRWDEDHPPPGWALIRKVNSWRFRNVEGFNDGD